MNAHCYESMRQDYNSIQDQLLENTLGNSMGTQTAMIPKPTYKELTKHTFLARITAQLEISECDGYCTSNHGCKFTKKIVKANIVIPVEYDNYPFGKIKNVDNYKWANHLPVPVPEFESGDYMFLSDRLLRKYDREYKYTIKNVKIVKNKKYISEPKVEEEEHEVEEVEVEDRRQTHTVKEAWKSMMTEDEEKEEAEDMADAKHRREYCEKHGEEYDDECWYEPPIKTITVKQMMLALDKLPRNAQLVITEEGFYSHTEFAKMMLPEPYAIKNKIPRLPDGTQVYRIGHSYQNY
jgi:hypothetical protein